MLFTLPILDADAAKSGEANEIDRTPIDLDQGQMQKLLDHVTAAVEVQTPEAFADLRDFAIEQSIVSGELARVRPNYEVHVGNIGNVYSGQDRVEADKAYVCYVGQSKTNLGRAGGETVTMFCDDEIDKEYNPE